MCLGIRVLPRHTALIREDGRMSKGQTNRGTRGAKPSRDGYLPAPVIIILGIFLFIPVLMAVWVAFSGLDGARGIHWALASISWVSITSRRSRSMGITDQECLETPCVITCGTCFWLAAIANADGAVPSGDGK